MTDPNVHRHEHETGMEDPANASSSEAPVSSKTSPPLSKLLRLAQPEWRMLLMAFLLMIVAEATSLLNPILLANAYDTLVRVDDVYDEIIPPHAEPLTPEQRMRAISETMIWVLTVHAGGILFGWIRASIMGVAGERIVARLRNQLYESLLKQEIAFFDDHRTGELLSRLTSDTSLLQGGTSQALPEVLLGIVKLVVSIGLMFWISPQLAAVTLGGVLAIFVFCVPYGKWIGYLSRQYQDVLGTAQTYAAEALGSMRTVQSFAAERREHERYRDIIGDPDQLPLWWPSSRQPSTYRAGFFKAVASAGFFSVIFGFGFGLLYVSLWYGFKLVNNGSISLGELTAFQSYIFQIGGSLSQTARFFSQLLEAQGASGRIFHLLERIPAIPGQSSCYSGDANDSSRMHPKADTGTSSYTPSSGSMEPPLTPSSMEGFVEFDDVSFSYPSRPDVPVIRNFTLSIPTNTTTALVGSSGAGKSTVVALLQRFYDVNDGSIRIDGIDLRKLDLHWLRSNVGYVQQEPQLFGMTVRENICYGVDREVSQDELEEVSRNANAHDFITKWPQGYETVVGERGVKLSGGQKQRLAIARGTYDPARLQVDTRGHFGRIRRSP